MQRGKLRRGLLAPVPTVEALKQVIQHLLFAVAVQVANVETHFANPRHATVFQAQPEGVERRHRAGGGGMQRHAGVMQVSPKELRFHKSDAGGSMASAISR